MVTPPLYALDTDTGTLLRGRDPRVVARYSAVAPTDVAVTVITVEEFLSGWYTYLRRARTAADIEFGYGELAGTVRFLRDFRILDYTASAIAEYGRLHRLKLGVRANDLRIAATALVEGATVVTCNVRDFSRVPGLVIEDWSV